MKETSVHLPEDVQQLISGCVEGNRSAQARLYTLYCHKMMGVCLWYAKNKQEAEEILQDGFLRVFTYLNTYNGDGPLEGWIRKVMINAALQKFRNRKSNYLQLVVEYNTAVHDSADTASFLHHYDEKELLKLVQSLSPVYRMVFSLYVLEGYKHKEIAAQLGISEGTCKSNLADARLLLQRKVYELHQTVSFIKQKSQ